MVAIGYPLPFHVHFADGILSCGQAIEVRVAAHPGADMTALASTLRLFSDLGNTGALSGATIPPEQTICDGHLFHTSPSSLTWRIDQCRVADEALIVLAHMLLARHRTDPIVSVEVAGTGTVSRQLLQVGNPTFPGLFRNAPFVIDDAQPEGGSYTFHFDFAAPPTNKMLADLNWICEVWVQAILAGSYALAPLDPVDSYVEVDEPEVAAFNSHAEWAVFKLMADPDGSLHGFLNALMAFHARHQHLARLEIL